MKTRREHHAAPQALGPGVGVRAEVAPDPQGEAGTADECHQQGPESPEVATSLMSGLPMLPLLSNSRNSGP